MSRVNGIDVSRWQDNNNTSQQIDFVKAKTKADFVFIKVSQNDWMDEDFIYNWKKSKEAGFLRGGYHFYDYRYYPEPQADFFWSRMEKDPGELPPVLDLEDFWKPFPSRENMLSVVQRFLLRMESLSGKRPIFYSNPNMILYLLRPIPEWLTKYKLWIAHYGVNSPAIGAWDRWTFWQYTSNGIGIDYGVESKSIDLDYYNGTLEDLKKEFNIISTPIELSLEQKVDILWKEYLEDKGL